MFQKLYNSIINLAKTPAGPLSLFILSFAEASFFPIPPDVLLIALCLGCKEKTIKFALICSIGSVLGGIAGYFIGYYLWWNGSLYTSFASFFFNHIPGFSEKLFQNIQEQYNIYGFIITFTAGFSPIPYKIFTISAGAFDISFIKFVVASIISRSARFFLVAALLLKFGDKIRIFIERYFNSLTLILTFIILGAFFIIKYLII